MSVHTPDNPLRVVVLISGQGSNLQAILDAIHEQQIPARVVGVISNRAEAYGLERAHRAGMPTRTLSHREQPTRAVYDAALRQAIDAWQPDLLVLAGFMRILSDEFVEHYRGRMLNIHPSLLPKYKGLDTHQRALDAGDREHGCSVHFVTPELDSGPVLIQARVPILPGDDAASLAERVHNEEHRIYPQAIRWIAEGRVKLTEQGVLLDGHVIELAALAD